MNSLLLLGQEKWITSRGVVNWFPVTNSTQAASTDALGMVILWVSTFSFVGLMLLMCWFVWKYRRRPGVPPERSVAHNTPLELAWSIIPLLILVVIFFMGFEGYMTKIAAPVGAEEIYITGQKWQWSGQYRTGRPAGASSEEEMKLQVDSAGGIIPIIYVPAARPVKLIMQSTDVMHSFFIPDFRTKMDVFPNRFTSLWFEALEPGRDHVVFCAEYCGDNHSEMAAVIRVVDWERYLEVINSQPSIEQGPISEIGETLRNRRACAQCHTIDGTRSTGPSWKTDASGRYGWGTPRTFVDGTTIPSADEDYFRESILYSHAKVVETFDTSMPVYAGRLSDEEVRLFIMYIKYLNDGQDVTYTPEGEAGEQGQGEGGDAAGSNEGTN